MPFLCGISKLYYNTTRGGIMLYTLSNEYYTLTASDRGAEIVSLKSPEGYEYLWQGKPGSDWWDMQAPILFPLCGSFSDSRYTCLGKEYTMQMHGFALKSDFSLVEKTESTLSFSLCSNEQTLAEYPFDFFLTVKYELSGKDLILTATVRNDSEEVMPYMFGWHPGFNLPTDEGQDIEDYLVELGVSKTNWIHCFHDEEHNKQPFVYKLPDGKYRLCEEEIYFNDTMIFTAHKNEAKLYAEGHPYTLFMKWSENLPTLCIWKQETNDAKFVCIEPWCEYTEDRAYADNYDKRQLPRLMPGKTEEYRIRLSITK